MIALQLAHFQKAEIRLKLQRPLAGKKRKQGVARFARAQQVFQRRYDARFHLVSIGAKRQPLAAPVERATDQSVRRIQARFAEQSDEATRQCGLWRFRQLVGKGLPQFVKQPRIRIDQRGARQIGRQGRGIDELQEPTVKRVDGQPRLCRQYLLVQATGGAHGWLVRRNTTLLQKRGDLSLTSGRQQVQPVDNPLFDLPRRLARKGNRQDLARRNAGQQQAYNARGQQPGLAAPGTGFDDNAVRRIERIDNQRAMRIGHGVSGFRRVSAAFARRHAAAGQDRRTWTVVNKLERRNCSNRPVAEPDRNVLRPEPSHPDDTLDTNREAVFPHRSTPRHRP